MKGKLTPRESFALYGVFIVAAFALFLLGLYWGKGQATGLSQEITTQPVATPLPSPAARRPQVQTRLEVPKETVPPQTAAVAPAQQETPVPAPPSSTPGTEGKREAKPPVTSPGGSGTPATRVDKSPAPSSGKEAFSIQVGALKTEEEARKVIVRLEARGYTGILDKPVSQRDPFFRVRVGNYPTREDAARAEALLKEEGFLTFIKKTGR